MTGTLWGITTYFNPSGYQTKLANYHRFRARSRAQALPLIAVELAFDDGDFVLRPGVDAEILVQKRASSVLWQKERLFNLALAELPADCAYIALLDADVLFEDDDWVEDSVRMLQDHAALQPFRCAIRLPRAASPADYPSAQIGRSILKIGRTRLGPRPEGSPKQVRYKTSYCAELELKHPSRKAATGYAWCLHRSIVDGIGVFDRCILGGGDRELALALGHAPDAVPRSHVSIRHVPLRTALAAWHVEVHRRMAGRRIAYLPGTLHHLWHGAADGRQYRDRHEILSQFEFSPSGDIQIGESGCWEWSTDKRGLVEAVRAYFDSRKEDG